MIRFAFSVALCLAPLGAAADIAQSSLGPLKVEKMVGGLERPWGFEFLPDGGIIVTERPGRLRIWRDGRLSPPLAGLPKIRAGGQGGLLDVALARDFARTGEIYLSYSGPVGLFSSQTRVARARLAGDRLEGVKIIFRQEPAESTSHHYGSRIAVAPDGSLFVTLGERGQREEAQNPANHLGAVIHILRDGSPHPDNPFIGNGRGWRPEIWSYGHRNPQGVDIGPDGTLWTVEHGPKGGDEINRPLPGRNYGWPVIGYGVHYNGAKVGVGTAAPGMEQPVHYWDPSIAPSSLAVYDGSMFPEWRGDLLVGALKFQLIARLDMEDGAVVGEERLLAGAYGRIRDVKIAPDGAIWFATDSAEGGLYRVSRP